MIVASGVVAEGCAGGETLTPLDGNGCLLIQHGDPAPSTFNPCSALDHGACGKSSASFFSEAQRLVVQDYSCWIGHKSADMAKFISRDRAFVHRREILWLGDDSRLKDHDRVRRYKLFERVCISVLSGFPDSLLELNDRIDDRALGIKSVGLLHRDGIARFQEISPAMRVCSSGSDAVG